MTHREASKREYGLVGGQNGGPTIDELNAGSFQRQADAQERMATALEKIASTLSCGNCTGAARALIRMDKRMAKKTPLSGEGSKRA